MPRKQEDGNWSLSVIEHWSLQVPGTGLNPFSKVHQTEEAKALLRLIVNCPQCRGTSVTDHPDYPDHPRRWINCTRCNGKGKWRVTSLERINRVHASGSLYQKGFSKVPPELEPLDS